MGNVTLELDDMVGNRLSESELHELIILIQELDEIKDYRGIYQLLVDNSADYLIRSDNTTKRVIDDLKRDIKPLDNTQYRSYYSLIKYAKNYKGRAITNIRKLLTHCFNVSNNTVFVSDKEKIAQLNRENQTLQHEIMRFKVLSEIEVPKEMKDNISNSLVPTNLRDVFDIDIFSSMKQKQKETDLIITRTYQFSMFAAGLLDIGLTLPENSIIYAKGGDGSTRFVRLLQGAGDLIKCSKELWSKKKITLAVISLNGDTLRMNVDNEASRIISEGIKQTLTTLINQAKTKKNSQVITSTLGALLRAGYPLEESINRMYQLLDTEKTITISEELAKKSIGLLMDGRITNWHNMNLCPNYSEDEITYHVLSLVGVGKGNTDKRCKAIKYHKLYEIGTDCPDCEYVRV